MAILSTFYLIRITDFKVTSVCNLQSLVETGLALFQGVFSTILSKIHSFCWQRSCLQLVLLLQMAHRMLPHAKLDRCGSSSRLSLTLWTEVNFQSLSFYIVCNCFIQCLVSVSTTGYSRSYYTGKLCPNW